MAAGNALAETSHLTYQYIRPPGRVSTFTADLVTVTDDMIAMELFVDRKEPLLVGGEEVLAGGSRAVWFLRKNAGWDIAAMFRPEGGFSGFYVDVLEPVYWDDADVSTLLPIVDLFLDLWIGPDGRYEVLDRDEFDEAAAKGWITEAQREHALGVLSGLEEEIRAGTFPPREVRNYVEY